MSIFDETFENEEAALNALKEALEERDGKFVVGGDLRKTFENAVGNATDSQKQRRRAQDAEASLRELKTSLAAKEAELDEILKLNPQETQKQLQEIAREKAALVAKLKLESDQLAPLQERLANYEKNERNAKIASALRDAAKTLGVRPEALRDVERLASAFSVDPNDETIRDSQGRDVATVVAEELKASPHWLPTSQGGGSTGSNAIPKTDADAKRDAFDAAEKKGDFLSMISATL